MQNKKGLYVTIRGEHSKKTSPSVPCMHLTTEQQNTQETSGRTTKRSPGPTAGDLHTQVLQDSHQHRRAPEHLPETEMIPATSYTAHRDKVSAAAMSTWGQLSTRRAEFT